MIFRIVLDVELVAAIIAIACLMEELEVHVVGTQLLTNLKCQLIDLVADLRHGNEHLGSGTPANGSTPVAGESIRGLAETVVANGPESTRSRRLVIGETVAFTVEGNEGEIVLTERCRHLILATDGNELVGAILIAGKKIGIIVPLLRSKSLIARGCIVLSLHKVDGGLIAVAADVVQRHVADFQVVLRLVAAVALLVYAYIVNEHLTGQCTLVDTLVAAPVTAPCKV